MRCTLVPLQKGFNVEAQCMLVKLSVIANRIEGLELIGPDQSVCGFNLVGEDDSRKITWIKDLVDFASLPDQGVILTEDSIVESLSAKREQSYLLCRSRSRYYVAMIYSLFFKESDSFTSTNNQAEALRAKGFDVGPYCYIHDSVTIGERTVIESSVTIYSGVVIGKDCLIRSNTVLGAPGLGLEWDGKEYLEFPQIGRLIIKDKCRIGPLSAIRKGALVNTVIDESCEIGSLCNVGHNVEIGRGVILTSSVCLSGSVKVGERAFFGVGSTVRNKIEIGAGAFIGQGAVVVQDVPESRTVYGNPGR